MGSLTQGENKIELLVLLSIILIPIAFIIYIMSGLFSVVGLIVWAFCLLTYGSVLGNVTMRVPEKHRKAVHGKSFLDMRVYRNKEQYTDYLFGVVNHNKLSVSDIDINIIEKDEHYERIRLSLCIDTERQLLDQELASRTSKPMLDEIKAKTFDPNSLELDKDEAHKRIAQMETKMIVQDGVKSGDARFIELQQQINDHTAKFEEIVGTLNKLIAEKDVASSTTNKGVTNLKVADKSLSSMSDGDIRFRINDIDKCEQRMSKLSHDDYLMAAQYRLFQVRRIFKDMLSDKAYIEIVHNYQPVKYFDTDTTFEYFILIMRRMYGDEFSFQEQPGNHEGYSVTIQSAPCASVVAGFALSDIPIFAIIYSPADADQKIDVVISAEALADLKTRVLIRLINFYKTEYENADLSILAYQSAADHYLEEADDLRQQIEEGEWNPTEDDFGYTEKIIKIVPTSAKIYMFIVTIVAIAFLWLYLSLLSTIHI